MLPIIDVTTVKAHHAAIKAVLDAEISPAEQAKGLTHVPRWLDLRVLEVLAGLGYEVPAITAACQAKTLTAELKTVRDLAGNPAGEVVRTVTLGAQRIVLGVQNAFKPVGLEDGSIVVGGNFTQLLPDTDISGAKNVTVHKGLFVNCRKPANWTILGGNWRTISFCSHLHPDYVAKGLHECAVDCEHRIGVEKIWQWIEFPRYQVMLAADSKRTDVREMIVRDKQGMVTGASYEVLDWLYQDREVE